MLSEQLIPGAKLLFCVHCMINSAADSRDWWHC